MGIQGFLQSHGIKYTVRRNGDSTNPQRTEIGLPNYDKETNRPYIGFMPETDIKTGDILTNPAMEEVCVTNVSPDFFHGRPQQLRVFYQTKEDLNRLSQISQPVFNIQNAYGSVIGTGNSAVINCHDSIQRIREQAAASDSPDRESMEQIISLLEMVINNQVPPSKGLFSKFSNVMSRHAWLSNSVAATILSWLMSQIP